MMSNYPLFEELQKYIRESESDGKLLSDDLIIRHKIAELKVEFEVGRLMIYRVAWLLSNGQISNFETSMTKTYCTEFQIRMVHAAMDILGLSGQLMPDSKYVPVAGQAMYSLLFSPAYTLQGGTSEILRNIVAMRGLGLPGGT